MRLRLDIGEVDFEREVLITADEERRLRPLELRLLAYMRDHAEVVLSPADLLRDVWGYAEGVETRTIYATVNRLRLAVERDPANPTHILTVPRSGYRFRPTVDAPIRAVPAFNNRFVGRAALLARLDAEIARSPRVTVHGPAGVGKSRLVLEWARGRPDVVWVDLAQARTLEEATRAIGAALGTTGAAGVAAALARHPGVVVLDDVDPVISVLEASLSRWEGRVVLTCRTAGVGARVPVGPLEHLADAAALLEARVNERRPDREPEDLTALLPLLGGLPLAIELAAPWLLVMSASELATHVRADPARLKGVPPPVAGGASRAAGDVAKSSSIEASLAWGWDLLGATEREALGQAAVFERSFDLRAARAVVVIDSDVAETLLQLVERSWLRVDAGGGGQMFSFYAGQREFVRARSTSDGGARARHTTFHVDVCASEDVEALYLLGGPAWQRLEARTAELWAALDHADEHGRAELGHVLARLLLAGGPLDGAVAVADRVLGGGGPESHGRTGSEQPRPSNPASSPAPLAPEAASRRRLVLEAPNPLAPHRLALQQFRASALRALGRVDEARAGFRAALDEAPEGSRERGRIQRALGVLEMNHGDPAEARRHLTAAHECLEAVARSANVTLIATGVGGGPRGEAPASAIRPAFSGDSGSADSGVSAADPGPLRLAPGRPARPATVRLEASIALAELGTLDFLSGDLDGAATQLERAIGPLRGAGTSWVYAVYLVNLGVVELIDGLTDSADRHLGEALALHRQNRAVRYEALALGNLALVALQRGDHAGAHARLDEAFALTERTGDRAEEGALWSNRGLVQLAEGALAPAGAALERAAEIATVLPWPRLEAEVLTRRARIHAALTEWSAAHRCAARAIAIVEPLGLGVELREARLVEAELWLAQGEVARARGALDRLPARATRAERALRERVGRGG